MGEAQEGFLEVVTLESSLSRGVGVSQGKERGG